MTKTAKSLLFAALFSVLIFANPAHAQTINAASCSAVDVQAAFNSVVASTTTVKIPACPGGVGWSTPVALNVPPGSTTISVIGAGNLNSTGGGDQTVIIDNFNSTAPLLSISTNNNSSSFVRLAGITFKGGSSGAFQKADGMVAFFGSSANVRVDHIHMNISTYTGGNPGSGLEFQGCLAGVTDHSIFDAGYNGTNNLLRVYNQGTCGGDSLGLGDYSWTQPTGLGSSNFMFVENNVFNNGAGDDCTKGGRYVWRFNTMTTGGSHAGPSVQTHPTGGGLRERGCRAVEIYKNTATAINDGATQGSGYVFSFFWMSAGTGVVWGNTIPSGSAMGGTGYRAVVTGHNMRTNNNTYSQTPTPLGWGYCGTNFNGTGSKWDGNTSTATGYPCIDQIGRGAGQRLVNDFPSVLNQAAGVIAWPNQALEPVYEWANAYSPVPNNPSGIWYQQDSGVNENQDYYLGTQDNGSPISFNGSLSCSTAPHCGVGVGTLSSRPASCTTGVAYWATDQGSWNQSGTGGQGVLYKCTSTNTWTLFYTPHTYPHPLTQGSSTGSNVSPPTSLTAAVQ